MPASPSGGDVWRRRTLLQTALADAAGESADVALSLNVVTWNSAIALGGLAGGLLLTRGGVSTFPPVVMLLVLTGLAIAWPGALRPTALSRAGATSVTPETACDPDAEYCSGNRIHPGRSFALDNRSYPDAEYLVGSL